MFSIFDSISMIKYVDCMFNYIFLPVLLVLGLVQPAFAADKNPDNFNLSASVLKQVADEWHVMASTSGDLNKDGRDDLVLVVEANEISNHFVFQFALPNKPPYIDSKIEENWDSQAAEREFMVFFAQPNGSFKHVFSNGNWVERADFGGMLGDSFDGIEIDRGSILLRAYGGSRYRWSRDIRIRYQEHKWRMIGYTDRSLDAINIDWEEYDRNLLTYKIKIIKAKADIIQAEYWAEITDKTKIYLTDSRQLAKLVE